MCYQGCVDEIPNFPHFDLAQGPHTFLYGHRVKGYYQGYRVKNRLYSCTAVLDLDLERQYNRSAVGSLGRRRLQTIRIAILPHIFHSILIPESSKRRGLFHSYSMLPRRESRRGESKEFPESLARPKVLVPVPVPDKSSWKTPLNLIDFCIFHYYSTWGIQLAQ